MIECARQMFSEGISYIWKDNCTHPNSFATLQDRLTNTLPDSFRILWPAILQHNFSKRFIKP